MRPSGCITPDPMNIRLEAVSCLLTRRSGAGNLFRLGLLKEPDVGDALRAGEMLP